MDARQLAPWQTRPLQSRTLQTGPLTNSSPDDTSLPPDKVAPLQTYPPPLSNSTPIQIRPP